MSYPHFFSDIFTIWQVNRHWPLYSLETSKDLPILVLLHPTRRLCLYHSLLRVQQLSVLPRFVG